MNWSVLLLMTAGLTAPQTTVERQQFDSYTEAYRVAGDVHKPMLVILNPANQEEGKGKPIDLEELKSDKQIAPLLEKYVVAVVDCGSDHGKKVHEVFGNKELPYVAVIDEKQDKQVFQKSSAITRAELAKVLSKYQNGAKAADLAARIQAPADCPWCQKRPVYGF